MVYLVVNNAYIVPLSKKFARVAVSKKTCVVRWKRHRIQIHIVRFLLPPCPLESMARLEGFPEKTKEHLHIKTEPLPIGSVCMV